MLPARRRIERGARPARTIPAAWSRGVVVVLAVLVVAAGCGGGRSSRRVWSVLATTPVLAALVRSVAGEVAPVKSVMPAGTDPHGFQPSARDRQEMLETGLLVVNGGDLEEGLLDVVDEASREGVPTIDALSTVPPLRYADGSADPHFWHDPQRAATFVRALARRLESMDPAHAASYRASAARSVADLDRLTTEVEGLLAPVPPARRLLVTNHDAYRYFAQRFDLEVVGTIVPGRSTQATPSAAHLADLARVMRERRVCVVFAEESESTAWARSLAGEVGPDVSVVQLYAGTLPDDSYDSMLTQNASRIATALARCG